MNAFFKRPIVIAGVFVVALALIVGGVLFGRRETSQRSALSARVTEQPGASGPSTPVPPSRAPSASPSAGGPGGSSPAASTATAVQAPPPRLGPPPIRFDSTGNQTTQSFQIVGGLTDFHWHCHCGDNFVVKLVDSSGATRLGLVDEKGLVDGSTGKDVAAGSYTLKIEADSRWTVNVEQPRPPHGAKLPHSFRGRGQMFVGPFDAGSSVRLAAKNSGEGNFIVEVLNAHGDTQDVAFNKVGDFDGSTVSSGLSGGPFYLNVRSGGVWSVEATQP
jgi:hypothetical protein